MGQHQFEELSSKIIEAGIAVHKALGPGFIEGVYQKAMEVAFRHRNIPFERQKTIHLYFEDEDLGVQRIDLLVCGEIVVELKAVERFTPIHFAQLKSYLRCLGLRVGLLLNFNAATLEVKRMVL
jgi:GxxExxY protein